MDLYQLDLFKLVGINLATFLNLFLELSGIQAGISNIYDHEANTIARKIERLVAYLYVLR